MKAAAELVIYSGASVARSSRPTMANRIIENGTPATSHGLDWPMHPTLYRTGCFGPDYIEPPPHYLTGYRGSPAQAPRDDLRGWK